MKVKKLDHVGILVRDMESALKLYRDRLGLPLQGIKEVKAYEVKMASLSIGEATIDLVMPYGNSPLKNLLEEKGEGLHHVCLEVADVKEALEELDREGVPVLSKEPGSPGDGTLTGHIDPKGANNVLVELKEKVE